MDKQLFKAEVRKQLTLRNWSYADLADHTKYTRRSINQMMYDFSRLSPAAMHEIASVLGIKLE